MIVDLAEVHREEHLGILGRHADQRRHPHPEQRARPPERDRGGDAGDVAGADGGRERRHQRGVGTDLALGAGFRRGRARPS